MVNTYSYGSVSSTKTSVLVGIADSTGVYNVVAFDAKRSAIYYISQQDGLTKTLDLKTNPVQFAAALQTIKAEVTKALASATKPADRLNLTWIKTSLDKAIQIALQYIIN